MIRRTLGLTVRDSGGRVHTFLFRGLGILAYRAFFPTPPTQQATFNSHFGFSKIKVRFLIPDGNLMNNGTKQFVSHRRGHESQDILPASNCLIFN